MKPRQLSVAIATFSYGGNGGLSSEHPDIRRWHVETVMLMDKDQRISEVFEFDIADTPITMSRNLAVLQARSVGADVLIMVDSDQKPDMHYGVLGSKKFFSSSFDFIYNNYDKGPHVVGAPYCGPPPEELVYVFRWTRKSSLPMLHQDAQFDKYGRDEAALLSGIQPCGGLPTGLIMYDMRIFDVTEPADLKPGETPKGWFYYEWLDKYAAQKASTEDGTATRDMSMVGYAKLKYNPVHCNWDAWAGHWKPYCVPKPNPITTESMNEKFIAAARSPISAYESKVMMGENKRDEERDSFFAKELNGHTKPSRHVVPFDSDVGRKMGPVALGDEYESAAATVAGFSIAMNTEDDMKVIARLAREANKRKVWRGVEVGSWFGDTSKVICDAVDAMESNAMLHCVDTWAGSPGDWSGNMAATVGPGEVYNQFVLNCQEYITEGCIRPERLASLEAAPMFRDESMDFVFIDANHDYEAVKADIEAWLPKVRPGGVLCGHDYSDGPLPGGKGEIEFPGVKQAVDEAFGDAVFTPLPGSSVWWIVK